jgi:hypothetical protein
MWTLIRAARAVAISGVVAAGLAGGFGCGNSSPPTAPDDDPAVRAEDERRHKEVAADEEAARKERAQEERAQKNKKGKAANPDD